MAAGCHTEPRARAVDSSQSVQAAAAVQARSMGREHGQSTHTHAYARGLTRLMVEWV